MATNVDGESSIHLEPVKDQERESLEPMRLFCVMHVVSGMDIEVRGYQFMRMCKRLEIV